jgi:hypothetical protein
VHLPKNHLERYSPSYPKYNVPFNMFNTLPDIPVVAYIFNDKPVNLS